MAPRRPNRPRSRLTPHLVGVLAAVHLGLLSPISCVITCAFQDMLARNPAIFLCGDAPAVVASPAPHDAPPAPTPRALYELVSLSAPLLAVAGALTATLLPRLRRAASGLAHAPPTPPPRPALT